MDTIRTITEVTAIGGLAAIVVFITSGLLSGKRHIGGVFFSSLISLIAAIITYSITHHSADLNILYFCIGSFVFAFIYAISGLSKSRKNKKK